MQSVVRRGVGIVVGVVVIACLGLLPAAPAQAAGPVVTNCLDNGSATTLRVAVANASAGETITFTPGLNCTSTGSGPITLTGGTLTLSKNVTIDASGATIVVDGGCTFNGTTCTGGGVTVFTVNSGVTANLSMLTIQHGSATVTDPGDGHLHGGGIFNFGTLTLTHSTVSGNTASDRGGGLYNTGTATVANSTFSGNATSTGGGGIANVSTLTVTNSTFSGNTASSQGGGIFMATLSTYTVTSSTFSGNTAPFGGSIAGGGGGTLTNTIFAAPGDLGGGYSGSNNLIEDASHSGTITDGVNGNIVGHPALLGTLDNDGGPTQTFPLLPGSPAIDAGAAVGSGPQGPNPPANPVPATDQRGVHRPQGTGVDIGAFEAATFTAVVNNSADGPADLNRCLAGNATTCQLRDAIAVANGNLAGTNPTITFDATAFPANTAKTITLDATAGTLTLTHDMTIDGTGHQVIVDGGCMGCEPGGTPSGGVTVFTVNTGTAALTALTIQHGNGGNANGGGIRNNGTLTLMDLTLTNNVASGGGGICCGPLNATRVTISNNTATGSAGGGIDALAPVTLMDTTVSGNTSAATGGGIYLQDTTTNLTNVTVSGNTTLNPDGGGGIRVEDSGTATLTNVTVSGNTAPATPGTGGGISVSGSARLNATRTIVAGNVNGDVSGNGVNGTNANNLVSTVASPITPLLAPLGAYGGTTATRPPLPGSPAINAGGAGCTGNDQRGVAWPQGGVCDIGAAESRAFMLTTQHDGQSAGAGTTFASPLAVAATGSNGDPVDGGQITFTIVPAVGGAAATFGTLAGCTISNGNLTAVCTITGGTATTPTLTANGILGTFSVSAAATGATTQTFSLTNIPGPATHFSVSAPGSATAGVAFSPLVVTALDQFGNTATGYTGTVHFSSSDPQATSGTGLPADYPFTVGDAGAHAFTATLKTAGTQTITAQDSGKAAITGTSTTIAVAAAPASITADPTTTPQSAQVGHAFTVQLKAIVKDAFGNPAPGVSVTFTAPGSSASGTFAGGVTAATTDTSGVATAPVFTANATAGGYSVTADRTGTSLGTPASFTLTNTAGPPGTITAVAGGGQRVAIGTAFGTNLQVKVTDASTNPVSGGVVTFTAPVSGASGTFAGTGTTTATATTNASGIATAPAFTANSNTGGYTVAASAPGVSSPATFALTNTVGVPASIVAVAGGGQSAVGNVAFATNLQAKVTDASTNPISGVSVTFTAPASGAGGTFPGSVRTATATTNASGIATAPTFTANTTAGTYTVMANLTSGPLATPAAFSLTNTHGAVTQVVISGVPGGGDIRVGQTLQLTATATYADGTTQDVTAQVSWSSSDTNVATVETHTGRVTIVGPGTVTITATWTTSGVAGTPSTVVGTTHLTVAGGTPVGIAPVSAPASRPGSAGTTPPSGAPLPVPNPVPTSR